MTTTQHKLTYQDGDGHDVHAVVHMEVTAAGIRVILGDDVPDVPNMFIEASADGFSVFLHPDDQDPEYVLDVARLPQQGCVSEDRWSVSRQDPPAALMPTTPKTVDITHYVDMVAAYADQKRDPGAFMRAVLANDLQMAVMRADATSLSVLPHIVRWAGNNVPAQAFGSHTAVSAWLQSR